MFDLFRLDRSRRKPAEIVLQGTYAVESIINPFYENVANLKKNTRNASTLHVG